MFSLLWNAAKYVLGSTPLAEPDIADILARLEDQVENPDSVQEPAVTRQDEEGCFYKTGQVTVVTEEYILIDDKYVCELMNVDVAGVKPGDKVYYLAFQRNKNEEQRVRRVISIVHDDWDDVAVQEQREEMIKRSIVSKVVERSGRMVFCVPGNVTVNLDKVGAEFVPFVGDWLVLESLVQVDEHSSDLGGEVLEVDNVRPLRTKLTTGIVTSYDPASGIGTIERNVVFNKTICEPGYIPCVGDKVVSDSIESDQGIHTWRSVSVVPLIQVAQRSQSATTQLQVQMDNTRLESLKEDKCGIVISNQLSFNLKIREEKDLVVEIKNTSSRQHVLFKGRFMSKKAMSQLSLVWPTVDTLSYLEPSQTISYIFRCRAKFVGISEELFVFSFKGFKIGRTFSITVVVQERIERPFQDVGNRKETRLARQDVDNQATYIPGIRPCKPPAFIAVRSGIFKTPQRFWDAVLGPLNDRKSQMEREIAVEEAVPCLSSDLTFDNYRDRFHALLYLEDIAQTIEIQRYDMESAVMRHCGEFLALEVPGLAEKRPSLLIGDKAVVSFKWDSSAGKLKYEGYVHKVLSSEVLLKFNANFHDTYNREDCEVSFQCSQSTIRRSHTAVNLSVSHLGPEFLFPVRVVQKEPQLDLQELDAEEKPKLHATGHERSQSCSSVCSSNSVHSASNSSSESVAKSPPRISVVERLFNAKPAVQAADTEELRNKNVVNENNDVSDANSNFSIGKNEVFNGENKMPNSDCNRKFDVSNGNSNVPGGTEDASNKENSRNHLNINLDRNVEPHTKNLDGCVSQLRKRKLIWFNKKLNYYQKEAVRNVLKGLARPLPYVIFGPPGTGKTITLCETILQIFITVPESRLLVATPSNSSANLIAERLLDSGVLKPGDLVRLVAHHCLEDGTIPENLLPYCATGDLAREGTRAITEHHGDGPKISCTSSTLGRHRITVGTCIALGILYNMGFPRGHFSHVVVDEAGQATEPEIMVPLNFIHSNHGQVVLAGDPMQLGPVVQSRLASHFGLGESFLSRLLQRFPYQKDTVGFETGYDPRLVTKLIMNYRSLPEILELPNSLFYDSELQPQVSSRRSKEADLLRLVAKDLPERSGLPPAIVFHGVRGENHQDLDSPSWYNPEEAAQVYFYLLKLYSHGLTPNDIGIITPYQKQVRKIRDLLLEMETESPKVGSVEEFQGQERNVIILSAVRSASNLVQADIKHALGFVASPRRLNVAITRPRALLIILGNPHLLAQDPYWRSVLIYCVKREAYTGCDLPASFSDNRLTATDDELVE